MRKFIRGGSQFCVIVSEMSSRGEPPYECASSKLLEKSQSSPYTDAPPCQQTSCIRAYAVGTANNGEEESGLHFNFNFEEATLHGCSTINFLLAHNNGLLASIKGIEVRRVSWEALL